MKTTLISLAALVSISSTAPTANLADSANTGDVGSEWQYVEHYPPDHPSEKDMKNFDPEWAYCGGFPTGLGWHLYHYFQNPYNSLNHYRNTYYVVNPDICRRLMCQDTTAMYVCNRTPHPIRYPAKVLQRHVEQLTEHCHPEAYTDGPSSGQVFFDQGNSSVVVGYGNCNHPSNRGPYYEGYGPNGKPHIIDKFPPPNWIPPEIFRELDAKKHDGNRWYEGGDGFTYDPNPSGEGS